MFSELKSFSLMGLPNSETFLSEKDLNSMEFNFLVRSTLELAADDSDVLPREHRQEKEVEEEEREEDKWKISVANLEIKVPSVEAFHIEDDSDDDGFKTPTSLDRKIPAISQCPPAPRKPKSLPSSKRKSYRWRVLLDLSNEIESLFPPALAADLGGKIKKVRQGNDTK